MSQTARFHQALIKARERGITRLDFEENPVYDGGPKILRVARCAGDLKDRGIHVVSDPHGGTGNCAVYWLAEHAPVGVVRNDGKPDRAPTPTRADPNAFQRVSFCHGCLSNRPHGTQCIHGRRMETMLVSGPPQHQACQRVQVLERIAAQQPPEVRRAA